MAEKLFYSMGEVAEMFDVNASLIRHWESQFSVIRPKRNKKGNRLFSPQDVENLKLIYHLVKERGMTLEGAKKALKQKPAAEGGVQRDAELMERLQRIRALLVEVREDLKAGQGELLADGDAEGPAAEAAAYAVFVVAAFAALRLAKFNIDDTQRTEFCGLPSPAAAMLCGSLGLLFETSGLELPREAISAIAVVVGLLMISNVRMFALKFHGFGWKGNELRYGFIIAAVVTAVLLRGYAVPAIIVLYILVSLVRGLACRTKGCGKAE